VNRAVIVPGGGLKLQATLSSSSSGTGEPLSPHHPITCNGGLHLEGDGTSWKAIPGVAKTREEILAPPGAIRTQFCIDHSISLLLMELSADL